MGELGDWRAEREVNLGRHLGRQKELGCPAHGKSMLRARALCPPRFCYPGVPSGRLSVGPSLTERSALLETPFPPSTIGGLRLGDRRVEEFAVGPIEVADLLAEFVVPAGVGLRGPGHLHEPTYNLFVVV